MSSATIREDVEFLLKFEEDVLAYIKLVREWEELDASAIFRAQEERIEPYYYHEEELKKEYEFKTAYHRYRTTINQDVIRLRSVASPYQLGFTESWLYHIPTEGQTIPGQYVLFLVVQMKTPFVVRLN